MPTLASTGTHFKSLSSIHIHLLNDCGSSGPCSWKDFGEHTVFYLVDLKKFHLPQQWNRSPLMAPAFHNKAFANGWLSGKGNTLKDKLSDRKSKLTFKTVL